MRPQIVTTSDRPDLEEQGKAALMPGWPEFILHDQVSADLIGRAAEYFPQLDVRLLEDGDVVAGGWAVALRWKGTADNLPGGYDGALISAIADYESAVPPDTLCAMAVAVRQDRLGVGLGGQVLVTLRARALRAGLERMIAPVRPVLKSRYPLTPMANFARWTRGDGSHLDPWIRTHQRLGATILCPAPRSMVVTGTIAEWQDWAGMAFPETGRYVVPGALDLVEIDVGRDQGSYAETNLWMRHPMDTFVSAANSLSACHTPTDPLRDPRITVISVVGAAVSMRQNTKGARGGRRPRKEASMMGRNKRGIRRASMRVRLAVAAAVLVGGGAAGVVAVNASHSSTATTAASAGYSTSWNSQMSWQQGMSWAMDNWNTSWQQSLVVITKTVTVKTVVVAPFHNHMFVAQRGTVVTKDPWEFVVKSSNGNFNLWHFNGGTKFVNIGNNKTGWNAMSGGTMSSWGSWNWSDYTKSSWNTHMKTLPKGALVFVFGVKEHGQLHAQLVLFAAPSSSTMMAVPSTSPTGWTMNSSNSQAPVPGSTFSGSHS